MFLLKLTYQSTEAAFKLILGVAYPQRKPGRANKQRFLLHIPEASSHS